MKLRSIWIAALAGAGMALTAMAQADTTPAPDAAATSAESVWQDASLAAAQSPQTALTVTPATPALEGAPVDPTVAAPAPYDPIATAAAVYATYQGDVSDIKTHDFTSSLDIDSALNNLGSHNSDQLTRGWLAYSALVASQDTDFVAAVRDIESYYGRDSVINGLQNDVRYARTLSGGQAAVSSALTAVEADAKRISTAAAFVKEQAYSLQASTWAKDKIGDSGMIASRLRVASLQGRPARPSMVTALSSPGINSVLTEAGNRGAPSLWESVTSAASAIRMPTFGSRPEAQPEQIASGKEVIADRIATLAAFRILGSETDSAAPIQLAMTERETASCLNMAQLNLVQCVAAAHMQFEVPFCIGEHALAEVGECIGSVTQ